ncbi:A-kinase anchor protein 14 isoform X5 [Tympanuchus pallidicinctus]|uniref:A-kinase anchor protein 14 isoform X5 n=1 Tax=Tympanuchus pallidicinctus TaxID=109042 RepID=UPI0022871C4B|nr:A-kinase anchor protein 14 isoform X5 [Tympanuchus pallidicinctus]
MDNENESAATEKVAHTIVKKAIHTAQEYYLNNVQEEEGKELALFATSYRVSELSQKDFHSILSFSEAEYAVRNIQWTTCEDFSVERGQQQIEEYISTLPVEVFFFLESSRLIHRPEHCRFREKWLKDIIENKIILRERLKLP